MARWLGLIDDPNSATGGTKLEDLDTDAIVAPTLFVPATTAQVDPGRNQLERTDEVRGRRGNTAPISFARAAVLTFENRCYPTLARKLLRNALGGAITSTGTVPASVVSTIGVLQSGAPPTLVAWLLREGQLDRVTGCAVNEVVFDFPIDGEGTIASTLWGLYHTVGDVSDYTDPSGDPGVALPTPTYTEDDGATYMLRDGIAYVGTTPTELDDFAGFGFTYNNSLIDDFKSRFRPGHNIETTVVDGTTHKVWFPNQHKLGPQAVTGHVDFSDVKPDQELLSLLAHADKLEFQVSADPLGTTPDADDTMTVTFYKEAFTDGGADPLVREGDQTSSYTFGAYIDVTSNKDVEVAFTGAAALT